MAFHGRTIAGIQAALLALCLLCPVRAAAGNGVPSDIDEDSNFPFEGGYNGLFSRARQGLPDKMVPPPPEPSTSSVPSAELTNFWEKLKNGVSDPLCKKAEVKLNKEVKTPDGIFGLNGGVRRGIKKYPDGNLALLDEIKLDLSVALGQQLAALPDVGTLNVGLSGRLEGKSQVVRPLESKKFCKEVLEWAKFYELKTVLPTTKKRIVKMQVGEIWKLPLSMTMSFSISGGANIAQVVNVSLSAAVSKTSKPSVSLRRLDADQLRLRLRLDRLQVKSVGVAASTVEIPLTAMGLEGLGKTTADLVVQGVPKAARKYITAEMFDKLLLKEINKYLSVQLSFGHSRFSGKKLLLEFILNPNNPEQMENLEKFLRGDFGIINRFIELGLKLNNFAEEDDALAGMGGLEEVSEQAGSALDADSQFAGTDIYHGRSNNFGLRVPVVGTNRVDWGSSYHRYQSMGKEGQTIHAYQKTRTYTGSAIDIPFSGTMLKHNSQKDVYVLNKENADGTVSRPVFLYQQYEGYVGRGTTAAETMLEKANGVLRYVGVNGDGVDNSNQLPVSELVASSGRYTATLMSFKLLINEAGVQDIIFAPAQAIMKAYMNMMRELHADIIDRVMNLFTFDKKGRVDYDLRAVEKALGVSASDEFAQGCNPFQIIDNLAYTATRVIRDIAGVRDAPDWKAQSEKLSRVAGGSNKSGLGYEDFLKVMVQLTKPANVSATVYVHMDPKKKGKEDVTRTYNYFDSRTNSYDATISDVTQMRERFSDPAELSD